MGQTQAHLINYPNNTLHAIMPCHFRPRAGLWTARPTIYKGAIRAQRFALRSPCRAAVRAEGEKRASSARSGSGPKGGLCGEHREALRRGFSRQPLGGPP